ncbi:hypothetical protein [Streptomyces sp. TLI_146]|uniref:hypothetical protein n=1 Tax=Streptomyces sp. TLI_146 TaxID=1938858 RepID=UPI000CA9D153|nr:hypothetical protein [Streptomyces sp. TLI_146]PKV90078.1 hypothetical protein BX283_7739 [Streptomyces sp. TLI_146]
MFLSALGLLLITLPLTMGGERDWPIWMFATMAVGLLVLTVFLVQQKSKMRKDGSPLVVLSLFTGRAFSAGLATQLAFGLLSGIFFLSWVMFMQNGLGLTPGQAAVGFVAASLADLTLGRVAHRHAGSASGLFNTATQLGVALGTALTTVVFFTHISADTRGPAVSTAFADNLWYVVGTLITMWALMLLLPKRTQTD